MKTNRLFSSVLLCLVCISLGTAVHAKPNGDEAARRNLSDKMGKAQERGLFKNVNKIFGQLERLKNTKLCWNYYQTAAEASRNLKDVEQIFVRYWKARASIGNGNVHCSKPDKNSIASILATIKAEQESWGRVRIRGYKSGTITPVDPVYEPEAQAAVENANHQLAKRGIYSGFLPSGAYTVKMSDRSKKIRKLQIVKGLRKRGRKRFKVKNAKWSSASKCIEKQDSAQRLRHEKCMKKVKPQKINLKRK